MLILALLPGLAENFESVTVDVVQCPNLTQSPFHLAAEGNSLQQIFKMLL